MPKKDAQRKSKGKTSKTSSLDDLVAAIEAKRGKQREDYKKAMAALQGLPPIVKAEGWLKFWAQELEDWGDLEAVVYGASRRQIDDAGVRRVLKMWRHAEQKAISRTDLVYCPTFA